MGRVAMKRRVRQAGAAAVELALLTSLALIPMTLIGIEGGRVFFTYNTLVKNVRDAARYLSTNAPNDDVSVAAAKNLAVYGSTTATNQSKPLVPGLTTAMVTVCDRISCPSTHNLQPTGNGVVNLVTVTITGYRLSMLFTNAPFYLPADPASLLFGRDISATMEQVL